ncbi:MAG: 3'(2'),5'-bisphosphate nucleotidase CysQ [Halobacteriovoraceae bacterium]|jgi:3'(2'), 5'-bisphosphate nucleotidase|nr:3'(2'),5'-bisphosphate nucleotidase CysQ [Halobacteriovoraceae bacterium]MBT5094846.1 3'(2'),5'-bisphosphate nucleotidase CysQ [Halobacteriovoraceae bacterium]
MNQQKLELVIAAAIEAGKEILPTYFGEYKIEIKQDQSPVTEADLMANDIIIKRLGEHFSDIPILSEESEQQEFSIRKEWKRYFCIDPIDGTKGFISKSGQFTINIALIEDNFPILGVIYWPVEDILYFATKGEGAYRVKEGVKEKLPCETADPKKLRVVKSKSHLNPETQEFIVKMQGSGKEIESVSIGSSLKFCMVAEGSAEVYPRLGPTSEWDTAAAQCIVEESGGQVLFMDSKKRFSYNKESLLNPHFLVLGPDYLDLFTT